MRERRRVEIKEWGEEERKRREEEGRREREPRRARRSHGYCRLFSIPGSILRPTSTSTTLLRSTR